MLDTIQVASGLSIALAVILIIWCIWKRPAGKHWALGVVTVLAIMACTLFNLATAETTQSSYLNTPTSCPPPGGPG